MRFFTRHNIMFSNILKFTCLNSKLKIDNSEMKVSAIPFF